MNATDQQIHELLNSLNNEAKLQDEYEYGLPYVDRDSLMRAVRGWLVSLNSHRYYFLNRPPSIGTHPAGEVGRKCFQYREDIPGIERLAHGWVEYPEALGFDMVWRYELYPADEEELARYNAWRETFAWSNRPDKVGK